MADILSMAERERYGDALVTAYIKSVKKLPDRTPQQLIDIIYAGRKNWFDHLSQEDLDWFGTMFEKVSLAIDVDVHWDVSVKNQMMASSAFNEFLKEMKRHPIEAKRNTTLVTELLNKAFGRKFRIRSKTADIIKAFDKKPQLREVGRRLVKELSKMGYHFA